MNKLELVSKLKLQGVLRSPRIEAALVEERPRTVLVCGDANTNLAGALAARKLNIAVGHVESGLRSHDWRMPEEHNRVIIDHISEYLFAPTPEAKENLLQDNVKGKIYVTGNTVVDALTDHIELAARKTRILKQLQLEGRPFILLTCHREENVDNGATLSEILTALQLVAETVRRPMVFLFHSMRVLRDCTLPCGCRWFFPSIPGPKSGWNFSA